MAAAEDITRSLAEHRLNKWYYERWQRDNKVEAPKVIAYLDGGPRPSDSEVPTHYGKGLLFAEDTRRALVVVPDPQPEPGELPFALPTLTNPIVINNVPSRYSQGSVDNDFMLPEAGRDYLIDLGRDPRHGLVLNSPGRVGNVQIVNGHFNCSAPKSQSDWRRGGLRMQIRGKHVSVTDLYVAPGSTMVDAFAFATSQVTTLTIQRSYLGGHPNIDEASAHPDALQCQGPVGRLEVGLCTLFASGEVGHGGKGVHLDFQSAVSETPAPYEAHFRKVDINGLGTSSTGAKSSILFGKDDRSTSTQIRVFFDEVYGAAGPGGLAGRSFEQWIIDYGSSISYSLSGTAPNRVMTFTNSSQGWNGAFRERAFGTHFVTPVSLGY